MAKELFKNALMCKACKYSKNMPFYRNVYSCSKTDRLFLSGDHACINGEIVSRPDEITSDYYIPQSWKECEELTAKRNGG